MENFMTVLETQLLLQMSNLHIFPQVIYYITQNMCPMEY
jgi:hypothetical protein